MPPRPKALTSRFWFDRPSKPHPSDCPHPTHVGLQERDVVDHVICAALNRLSLSWRNLAIRCGVAHFGNEFARFHAYRTNVPRHVLDCDAALIPNKLEAAQ